MSLLRFFYTLCLLSTTATGHAATLTTLHWFDAEPDERSRTAFWQAHGIAVNHCSDLTSCITEGAGGYLVLSGLASARFAEVYEQANAQHLQGVIVLGAHPSLPGSIRPPAAQPRLLALAQQGGNAASIARMRKLVGRLRNKGVSALMLFTPERFQARAATLEPISRDILLHFMGFADKNIPINELLNAQRRWQNPPLDNNAYRAQFRFLRNIEPTEDLIDLFRYFYRREPFLLKQWGFDRMTAFDLMAYRDAVHPSARFVTLANHRGQKFFMDLDQYGAFQPHIITGVDHETNMYRFVWFYKTQRMYTWRDGEPEMSARGLGPALAFLKPLPEALFVPLLIRSAIPLSGITFSNDDPLAPIRNTPDSVKAVMTRENRCVYCHATPDIDVRGHHLNAFTGAPQGGFALPLAEYPPEVMQAFIHRQKHVADTIGMSPNYIADDYIADFKAWLATLPKPASSEKE